MKHHRLTKAEFENHLDQLIAVLADVRLGQDRIYLAGALLGDVLQSATDENPMQAYQLLGHAGTAFAYNLAIVGSLLRITDDKPATDDAAPRKGRRR